MLIRAALPLEAIRPSSHSRLLPRSQLRSSIILLECTSLPITAESENVLWVADDLTNIRGSRGQILIFVLPFSHMWVDRTTPNTYIDRTCRSSALPEFVLEFRYVAPFRKRATQRWHDWNKKNRGQFSDFLSPVKFQER